jgi:hypothetical protein
MVTGVAMTTLVAQQGGKRGVLQRNSKKKREK